MRSATASKLQYVHRPWASNLSPDLISHSPICGGGGDAGEQELHCSISVRNTTRQTDSKTETNLTTTAGENSACRGAIGTTHSLVVRRKTPHQRMHADEGVHFHACHRKSPPSVSQSSRPIRIQTIISCQNPTSLTFQGFLVWAPQHIPSN